MVFYFEKESYFEGVLLYGDLITMGATDRYVFYTLIFIHFSRAKYSYYIQNDISVLHIIVLVLSYNIFTFHSFFMDYIFLTSK